MFPSSTSFVLYALYIHYTYNNWKKHLKTKLKLQSDKSDQSVALKINKKANLNRANIFESDIFLYYRRVQYEKTTNPMICLAYLSLI